MVEIIIVIAGITLAILGLAYLARHGRGMFGRMQFTSQSSMYGLSGSERKHAIEEVQYVQEDEVQEDTGPDDQGVRIEEDKSERKSN
ncbi:MAG: hypothetical protein V2A56_03510 [bacterium]